jgi:Zn finger protein HypA/HybF involved in hydrogenase expression
MSTNGNSTTISIACEDCKTCFQGTLPQAVIYNGETMSQIFYTHEVGETCPKCGCKHIILIQSAQVMYAVVKSQRQHPSRIVLPGASLPRPV